MLSACLEVFAGFNIGGFIIRIGFCGPLYSKYTEEPPNSRGNY